MLRLELKERSATPVLVRAEPAEFKMEQLLSKFRGHFDALHSMLEAQRPVE